LQKKEKIKKKREKSNKITTEIKKITKENSIARYNNLNSVTCYLIRALRLLAVTAFCRGNPSIPARISSIFFACWNFIIPLHLFQGKKHRNCTFLQGKYRYFELF
jgi:hypothetical protein